MKALTRSVLLFSLLSHIICNPWKIFKRGVTPKPVARSQPLTSNAMPLLNPPPGQRCSGRNYGTRRCCTPENPCDEGEGDCDGPADGGGHDGDNGCKGTLVCGSNNCRRFGFYFHEKDDCCEKPTGNSETTQPEVYIPGTPLEPKEGQRCKGRNFDNGRRCCTPDEPCDEGEGDCDGPGDGGQHDGDKGCKGSLVCGSNNCKKFGAYYHEKDDCCEKPSSPLIALPVKNQGLTDRIQELFPNDKRCRGRNLDKGRCCTAGKPCVEGEGDCEADIDCNGDLVCGNNNCKAFGSFFHEKDDCCIQPELKINTQPISGPRCRGRNGMNGRECCTTVGGCVEGEGDCESDNDCKGNLVCGDNNCKAFGSFFHPKDDCCIKPEMKINTEPISGPRRCRGRNGRNGRECCTTIGGCVEGEGDCETDNDCKGNLVCGDNNCKAFGSFFHEKDDCCIKPSPSIESFPKTVFPLTEPPPGQRCNGRNYGTRRCCTPEDPCGEGEGDCDGPGDGGGHDGGKGCKGDLVCGSNNCKKFGLFFHEKDDCCEKPTTVVEQPEDILFPGALLEPPLGQRCSGRNYGARRCCTPDNPCDEGEGDCDGPGDGGQHDGDAGCKGTLVCGSNNCQRFGAYFHAKDDCCEKPGSGLSQPSVSPGWGSWEAWSQCSKSCGIGKWSRTRNCTGPTCRHKHQSQERFCNKQPCKQRL